MTIYDHKQPLPLGYTPKALVFQSLSILCTGNITPLLLIDIIFY